MDMTRYNQAMSEKYRQTWNADVQACWQDKDGTARSAEVVLD